MREEHAFTINSLLICSAGTHCKTKLSTPLKRSYKIAMIGFVYQFFQGVSVTKLLLSQDKLFLESIEHRYAVLTDSEIPFHGEGAHRNYSKI